MKLLQPELGEMIASSDLNERARRAMLLNDDVEGRSFEHDELTDAAGDRLDFACCRFVRCHIEPDGIKWISFKDCVFENCDLSGAMLRKASFLRVEFRDCRMVGGDFSETSLQSVLFQASQMKYANFSRAKMNCVRFEECVMDNAAFYECKNKAVAFAGGSLVEAELGGMPLKDLDLRSTDIRGIRVVGGELRGAIVSPVQAMELARILGVVIRE